MAHRRTPKMTDEVFWSLVEKTEDCWLWQGALFARTGYGKAGRRGGAHVVSYTLLVGPVPAGKQLDHTCRVRRCVRPSHLDPVTIRENLLRSSETLAGKNAAKTKCPQGHPYDEANTHHSPQGRRKCRTCMAEQSKKDYAKLLARRAPERD